MRKKIFDIYNFFSFETIYGIKAILIAHVLLNTPFASRLLFQNLNNIPAKYYEISRSIRLSYIGNIIKLEIPVLKQLAKTAFIYDGGVSIPPELIALTLALSLYTATFIAECVRAGIQGVSKGQKEAAASIGLTTNQILKLVIMPQALRIIIPPTTHQYLNLTKNSSLAAAIASKRFCKLCLPGMLSIEL